MRRVKRVASADKVHFAREQRQKPTAADQVLWTALRDSALGVHFRRQHPIGDFVLDFYCDEARLAIEVDGPDHAARADYDAWRDEQLARQGIRALRVKPEDVFVRLPDVLRRIAQTNPLSRGTRRLGRGGTGCCLLTPGTPRLQDEPSRRCPPSPKPVLSGAEGGPRSGPAGEGDRG